MVAPCSRLPWGSSRTRKTCFYYVSIMGKCWRWIASKPVNGGREPFFHFRRPAPVTPLAPGCVAIVRSGVLTDTELAVFQLLKRGAVPAVHHTWPETRPGGEQVSLLSPHISAAFPTYCMSPRAHYRSTHIL
jgi:hypothetical protein